MRLDAKLQMNNTDASTPILQDDERYARVPSDFPRTAQHGALAGAQPKYSMVKYGERFYMPGCTPPEIFQRWDVCEDLAKQLAAKSLESKAGKRAHMTEVEILDQYLPRLVAAKWTSEEEARWVMRRVAAMLGWPVPPSAQVHDTAGHQ